jgi:hypothetical protein
MVGVSTAREHCVVSARQWGLMSPTRNMAQQNTVSGV